MTTLSILIINICDVLTDDMFWFSFSLSTGITTNVQGITGLLVRHSHIQPLMLKSDFMEYLKMPAKEAEALFDGRDHQNVPKPV
jgi:hypothetical protein